MTLSLALMGVLAVEGARAPACDAALERAAALRLPAAEGPWLLRCIDGETLEVVRVLEQGRARARVVALSGVSEDLRVEVVVLAAQALLRAPAADEKPQAQRGAPALAAAAQRAGEGEVRPREGVAPRAVAPRPRAVNGASAAAGAPRAEPTVDSAGRAEGELRRAEGARADLTEPRGSRPAEQRRDGERSADDASDLVPEAEGRSAVREGEAGSRSTAAREVEAGARAAASREVEAGARSAASREGEASGRSAAAREGEAGSRSTAAREVETGARAESREAETGGRSATAREAEAGGRSAASREGEASGRSTAARHGVADARSAAQQGETGGRSAAAQEPGREPAVLASAADLGRTDGPTQLDEVVVPREVRGPLLRGAFWQEHRDGRVRPLAQAGARWFPLEGTWLVGGGVGVEWKALQALGRVSGSSAAAAPLSVRALVLEAAASVALACLGSQAAVGCLRLEGGAGAASLAGLSADAAAKTNAGWSPWAQASLQVDVVARAGALWLGAGFHVGAAVGPRATVAGLAGPGWAGLLLGAGLHGGWN